MNYRSHQPVPMRTNDRTDVHLMKVQSSEIEERLESTEILLHTMYRLLKKSGLTEEEFQSELDTVTKLHLGKKNSSPEVYCPKCGKLMQIGNISSTTANCMYCGARKTFSPFDKFESKDEAIEEEFTSDYAVGPDDELNF